MLRKANISRKISDTVQTLYQFRVFSTFFPAFSSPQKTAALSLWKISKILWVSNLYKSQFLLSFCHFWNSLHIFAGALIGSHSKVLAQSWEVFQRGAVFPCPHAKRAPSCSTCVWLVSWFNGISTFVGHPCRKSAIVSLYPLVEG